MVQTIGEAWLQLTARPWSQEAEENAYIVLNCIVLYLYIYIALLAVHTNQNIQLVRILYN